MTKSDENIFLELKNLLLILIAILVTLTVFWTSFNPMTQMWTLHTYQYGWFVYPISLVILWNERKALINVDISSSIPALGVLVAVLFGWLISSASGVQVAEFLFATLLIPALVWTVGGRKLLAAALFPLLFLLAAIPIGESIIPTLMEVTADIATFLLEMVGVPAYRDGMFLTLPGGRFEVADVCSGLRYLLSGGIITTLFAYFGYSSVRKRIIFVASASAMFVVANGIRAFIVMYVASASEMRHLAGRDHVVFGTILFIALAVFLVYFGARYADEKSPSDGNRIGRAGVGNPSIPVTIVAVSLLAVGAYGQDLQRRTTGGSFESVVGSLELGECSPASSWLPEWKPLVSGADERKFLSWDCDGDRLSVFEAVSTVRRQGRELVNQGNVLSPHEWRQLVKIDQTSVRFRGDDFVVNEIVRESPSASTVIWYWYMVDGKSATSKFGVKIREGLGALTFRQTTSSLTMLIVDSEKPVDELRARLQVTLGNVQ